MFDIIPVNALHPGGCAVVRQDNALVNPADRVGITGLLPQVYPAGIGFQIAGRRILRRRRNGGRRGGTVCGGNRRGGGVRRVDNGDNVAAEISPVRAVLDEIPGIAVLLDRLQQIRQGNVFLQLLDGGAADGGPEIDTALGGFDPADTVRINGGSRGRRDGRRAGVSVNIGLDAVFTDVILFPALGDRIPVVGTLFHGTSGQGQDAAKAFPVVV